MPSPNDPSAGVAALTQTGAPYEMRTVEIAGIPKRVFCNAPQSLGAAYRRCSEYAPRVFSVYGDQRLSYGEALGKAAALSRTLAARYGVTRGSRVAIAMHNRPEWMLAFIAITALGATAVLINSRGTAAEIAAALAETDVALVIADDARARLIAQSDHRYPLLVTDMPEPEEQSLAGACSGWENATLESVATQPDDEAVVMFTSGTTGGSKAVLLDQLGVITGLTNIQFSMAVIGQRIAARHDPATLAAIAARQPSTLLAVPLFHSSGCYSIFLSNLLRGGKVVILPKWNAAQALDLIEREQIMAFSGSPTMLWDMLRIDRSERNLDSLLSLGVGGQALQPQLLRETVAAFPRAVMGGGYGMTEANGSVCLIAGEDLLQRPTSSGQVIATAELCLTDNDGKPVAPGEVGEITVRGAMVMRGYCKRPEETAAVLRNGWLLTGDLGYLDADGYLYVIDRKKDIVISGGENIACSEVEAVAMEYPGVTEVGAFGVPDARLGEILVLAVVTADGRTVDTAALKNHIAAALAIYKVPRDIFYCAELPRNALGKLNRNELRLRYRRQQAGADTAPHGQP